MPLLILDRYNYYLYKLQCNLKKMPFIFNFCWKKKKERRKKKEKRRIKQRESNHLWSTQAAGNQKHTRKWLYGKLLAVYYKALCMN